MKNTEPDMAQNIMQTLKKHGFPDKKVALPLERMYEIAHRDGLNFNKVLAELKGMGVGHEKTTEKIIFFKRDGSAALGDHGDRSTPWDLSSLNMEQLRQQSESMMKTLSPDQLNDLQKMLQSLTPEERQHLEHLARSLAGPGT
jgi:hypothetical protein